MTVKKHMDISKKLTKKQLEMLERAEELPVTFDEDSPELSDSELKQFKKISEFQKEERKKQSCQ